MARPSSPDSSISENEEDDGIGEVRSFVNSTEIVYSGRRNKQLKEGWSGNASSQYVLASTNTFESAKVADNLADFAENDDTSKKTWSRRFVEKRLIKWSWYYPNKNERNAPDLNVGWAFFEHVTLARHLNISSGSDLIERAEPGERRQATSLYSFFTTPGENINDWGIGVALYFNTVKVMAFGLFLAGLVSVPNILFYGSEEYSGVEGHQSDLPFNLKGSAICTQTSWVVCDDGYCDTEQLERNGIPFATSTDGGVFVKRNDCDGAQFTPGMFNFGSIMLLLVITLLFSMYQSKKQVIYDEDRVTASDYSIRVKNPPKDAYDPDEWEKFFSQYDLKGVAVVTVLLNNGPLLRQLLARRFLRKELQKWLVNTDIDNEEDLVRDLAKHQYAPRGCAAQLVQCLIRPIVKPFNRLLHANELHVKFQANKERIQELQQKEYDVTDVIVTFETEEGQRNALESLNTSKLNIRTQKRGNLVEVNLFRGSIVLHVVEPAEPSAIRYLDLDSNGAKKFIQQTITLVITCGLVALGGIMVNQTRQARGPFWAGILTTTLNMLIPTVVKLLMFLEQHTSEGGRQKSMYLKITLFRWVNTAITVKFVTPFTRTLQGAKDDLIPAITGIFVSEMFVVPIIGLLDIMGNLSKHYFAPRAKTLHQMLLCFKGTPYNLAEKYTDVSKIVFLAYYYCALIPSSLFMGFIALVIRYYADKYCLMRIWSAAPYIGTGLATFSRRYFFSFAIVAGAVVSAYDWALFRFDRVCNGVDLVESGDYTVSVFGETGTTPIFVESTEGVRVCTANECCQNIGFNWPPVPGVKTEDFRWMSEEQEQLTQIYGWTSFALVITFVVLAFGTSIMQLIVSQFKGTYAPSGKDQNIDFSSVKDIDGYIPQLQVGSYAYPLLACDIDDIDQSLIGWNDPGTSYDESNIIFDVPYAGLKRTEKIEGSTRHLHIGKLKLHKKFRQSVGADDESKPIFSIVKHWTLADRVANRVV